VKIKALEHVWVIRRQEKILVPAEILTLDCPDRSLVTRLAVIPRLQIQNSEICKSVRELLHGKGFAKETSTYEDEVLAI
jgi:hypothetical protein